MLVDSAARSALRGGFAAAAFTLAVVHVDRPVTWIDTGIFAAIFLLVAAWQVRLRYPHPATTTARDEPTRPVRVEPAARTSARASLEESFVLAVSTVILFAVWLVAGDGVLLLFLAGTMSGGYAASAAVNLVAVARWERQNGEILVQSERRYYRVSRASAAQPA